MNFVQGNLFFIIRHTSQSCQTLPNHSFTISVIILENDVDEF